MVDPEDEEFAFRRRMEQEQAASQPAKPDNSGVPKFSVPSRPIQFNTDQTQAARMTFGQKGTIEVPVDSPMQRFLYESGGRVTDKLANAGVSPEVAAAAGYGTNLLGQIGTTFLGGNLGAKAEPALQNLGVSIMQRALKPTPLEIATGNPRKAECWYMAMGEPQQMQ